MKEQDLDIFLAELKDLINIESPSNHLQGISNVADIFEAKAKSIGLQVKRVVFDNKAGDYLVISNNLEANNFDVMLSAHMDTVFEIGHIKKALFTIDGNMHTAQEFGEIDTIIPRTNFLTEAINDLVKHFKK